MNIAQAKQIPLQIIVEHLGGRYSHTDRKGEVWYFSPFRPGEKTASFKINPKTNKWHDFGQTGSGKAQGIGGDGLDLWSDYHHKDRRFGIKEALQELARLNPSAYQKGNVGTKKEQGQHRPKQQPPRYKILKIADRITFIGLKEELQRRRISYELANLYLKQGYILDTVTGKKYYGILFENDKGGYEVSIPNPKRQECFKTCIGAKASTYIQPLKDCEKADVFEGFWDWLSWLEMKKIKHPIHHSFILNSTSLSGEVSERIISMRENIDSVFLFMDNDEAGFQSTYKIAGLLDKNDTKIGSFEYQYKNHKDLNAYWQNQNR
ncbi:toprim domain-containing protein [Rufibacter quisquiliarum]|uniref:DNA primase n=1 Tax=Rufibacter quisquiliarum TaxID=1549639 RepID=A0A839GAJ7_9BACT|nr:toprim domain-containing protein [Rufibacter quisquiliarum]MBA9076554.1 hypothetical protein [Rufibacter quisquiliarum]